jgi:hypothetical protein
MDERQTGKHLVKERTSCTGGTRKTRSWSALEEKIRMTQQDANIATPWRTEQVFHPTTEFTALPSLFDYSKIKKEFLAH